MKLTEKSQIETWRKISGFKLDEEGTATPFSKKLSKENNWSPSFAARAIEEYKRFIFLSIISPNGASPSDIVDAVWHLHLTFTKSYWEEFCGKLLRKSIHHYPSKGGYQEKEKHVNWYKQTIELYKDVFDEDPPTDIWPPPAADNTTETNINNPVEIEKPVVVQSLLLFLVPFIFIILFFGQPVPFLLSGTHFLQFYLLVCFVATVVVYLINHHLSAAAVTIANRYIPSSYNIFDAIVFLFGKDRALQAAIIDLMKKDIIEIDGKQFLNKATDAYLLRYKNPLVPMLLREPKTRLDYKQFARLFREEGISDSRLLKLQDFVNKRPLYPIMIFVAVALIGIARMMQGIANDKPVELLVFLLALFTIIFWTVYNRNSKPAVVKNIFKEKFEQVELTSMGLQPHDEILRSFALNGTSAIKDFKEYSVLSTMFAAYTISYTGSSETSFSSGSSSCGSSCGGGCGGGCGGCGGD